MLSISPLLPQNMPISILIFSVSCSSQTAFVTQKNSKTSISTNKSVKSTGFHNQFLNQVNIVRAKSRQCGKKFFPAVPPLSLHSDLIQAAYKHSQDMFKHQFLGHTSSNGDTLAERMGKVKYSWQVVGENIAHNQNSIRQVIAAWLSSPGHCSNMMSADYTQTGVANVNKYWTQVYAAPK